MNIFLGFKFVNDECEVDMGSGWTQYPDGESRDQQLINDISSKTEQTKNS